VKYPFSPNYSINIEMEEATPTSLTTTPPSLQRTPRDNALQSRALADALASSERLIRSVLTSPELLLALAPAGYNEVELNKGLTLFTTAQAKFDARQEALGVATLARKARDMARAIMKKEYRSYRTIVQVNYRKADRANLGANGRMPTNSGKFLTNVRNAYKCALNEPYLSVLSIFGFTQERLTAALAVLDKVAAAENAYENAESKAQAAAESREIAAAALKHWTMKLRAIAKNLLMDHPALLDLLKD
jgi:hypothetical protein